MSLHNCNQIVEQLMNAISEDCYYEVVNNKELEEIGLEREDIRLPEPATYGSAGSDFYAPVDISLVPNASIVIATGVKAHCAPFTMLNIYPRSGLGFKYFVRLANTVGVIDSDYYGNEDNDGCIFVKIRNEGQKELKIKKGEAFCQGIFQFYIPNKYIKNYDYKVRTGGIGSTDVKPENDKKQPVVKTWTTPDGTVEKRYHEEGDNYVFDYSSSYYKSPN